jgi:hypothetical protein
MLSHDCPLMAACLVLSQQSLALSVADGFGRLTVGLLMASPPLSPTTLLNTFHVMDDSGDTRKIRCGKCANFALLSMPIYLASHYCYIVAKDRCLLRGVWRVSVSKKGHKAGEVVVALAMCYDASTYCCVRVVDSWPCNPITGADYCGRRGSTPTGRWGHQADTSII